MTIELTGTTETQLKQLAQQQGREIAVLVEEAVRDYLAVVHLRDVEPWEVAETQMHLLSELPRIPEWKDGGE